MIWSKTKYIAGLIAKNIWLVVLFVLVLIAKCQAGLWKRKEKAAGESYRKTQTDVINSGWKEAGKFKQQHDDAQSRAKFHEKKAKERIDAITKSDPSLDDMLDQYRSDRLHNDKDAA